MSVPIETQEYTGDFEYVLISPKNATEKPAGVVLYPHGMTRAVYPPLRSYPFSFIDVRWSSWGLRHAILLLQSLPRLVGLPRLPRSSFLLRHDQLQVVLTQSVNYRGSTGFGRKNLTSLPGNCGNYDIVDSQVPCSFSS